MEGDAARELTLAFYKQEAALRRSVVARQSGEFSVEVLKAETEAEGLRVFQK